MRPWKAASRLSLFGSFRWLLHIHLGASLLPLLLCCIYDTKGTLLGHGAGVIYTQHQEWFRSSVGPANRGMGQPHGGFDEAGASSDVRSAGQDEQKLPGEFQGHPDEGWPCFLPRSPDAL